MMLFLLFAVCGAQILYPPTYYSPSTSIYQPYVSAPATTYVSAPATTYVSAPATTYLSAPTYPTYVGASTTTYLSAPATSYLGASYVAPQTSTISYSQPSFASPVLGAREQAVLNVVQGVNYALTLEHLEDVFYRNVNSLFSNDADYLGLTSSNGERFNAAVVHARVREIGSHESSHVVTLTNLVNSLCSLIPTVPNCAPVSECTYNFNLGNAYNKNINAVMATAELLENTGVKAYDGAISSLIQLTPLSADGSVVSASIVQAAATIATVEARHASFLSTIRGMDPFPQATDTPVKPNDILCAARQFVVNPSTCAVFNTASC